jgi:antitoxin HicB
MPLTMTCPIFYARTSCSAGGAARKASILPSRKLAVEHLGPRDPDVSPDVCLATRRKCHISLSMTGNELLCRLRRLGSERGSAVRFAEERGKGSHGTVYYGERATVLKDRRAEIAPGLLHAMLRQSGAERARFAAGEAMIADRYTFPVRLEPDEAGRLVVHFPDLPEALTDGADVAEALAEAADCLSEALAGRINHGGEIPLPSRPRRGQHLVSPEATFALKAALYSILRTRNMTVADLARRLDIEDRQAARLVDPRAAGRLVSLEAALSALGYMVAIGLHEKPAA